VTITIAVQLQIEPFNVHREKCVQRTPLFISKKTKTFKENKKKTELNN